MQVTGLQANDILEEPVPIQKRVFDRYCRECFKIASGHGKGIKVKTIIPVFQPQRTSVVHISSCEKAFQSDQPPFFPNMQIYWTIILRNNQECLLLLSIPNAVPLPER